MRISGVGFPSYGATASWTLVSGSVAAELPQGNLADLLRPLKCMRCTSSTATLLWDLPAAKGVQMIALIHHNLQASATVRIMMFSDPEGNGDIVYDSGVQAAWPGASAPVSGFRMTRPYVFPAPVTARSGKIIIDNAGVNIEIGTVEVSGFWQWPGIQPGQEVGFDARSPITRLAGGMDIVAHEWMPRVAAGEINLNILESTTTGLEFQKVMDQERPFVWVPDASDATTWARTCMLARNQSVDELVGSLYRRDSFPFSFIEHLR